MKGWGRNGKWFGTGNWWTVRAVRVVVLFKFGSRVGEYGNHVSVWGEDGSRSWWGSVNGEERAIGRELAANFFFFYVKKTSDVFNHLLVGESHF